MELKSKIDPEIGGAGSVRCPANPLWMRNLSSEFLKNKHLRGELSA
jgi:hypothetical protein